jgi:hypothetical protein
MFPLWQMRASRLGMGWTHHKKADVAEHHEVFRHVGLLANESPG